MDIQMVELMFKKMLYDYLLENSISPDEEFKQAEERVIEKLKVETKDNFLDYYEEN